jgi:hypothetical protein
MICMGYRKRSVFQLALLPAMGQQIRDALGKRIMERIDRHDRQKRSSHSCVVHLLD